MDERTMQALNERYHDLLRAAERGRFIRLAEAGGPLRLGLTQRALAQAGRWLIALGRGLEARYGLPSPSFNSDVSIYSNISKY